MQYSDFLVIGSGIAGLTFALKVAEKFPGKKIIIITKSDENESNTKYAQGGIAVAVDKIHDSFQQHIEDTLKAGDGLCDRKIVEMVVKEGLERFDEIIRWGASFDKYKTGKYHLGIEGGHSVSRVIHHKDATGLEIEKKLLNQIHHKTNIKVFSNHFAIDIITEHHLGVESGVLSQKKKYTDSQPQTNCYGAYVLNRKNNCVKSFFSKITLIASGGIGQVYHNTTNPLIATGDGIAIAKRAGARVKNMEFVQFHPTALFHPSDSPQFLISEAVRGFGATLKTKSGKSFISKYDERAELASRDIVARAIDSEMKKSGDDFVFLDCRHLDYKTFSKNFPNIFAKCKNIGIDIRKDMIPIVPAAHYLCGGIVTDENGLTSIGRLYACGECAHTGLHGANRLASNSLLEALVFANRCFENASERIKIKTEQYDFPDWDDTGTSSTEEMILISHKRKELQNLMSDLVGIVRTNERLKLAKKRIGILYREILKIYNRNKLSSELCELRNMVIVASLVIKHSINRKENRGVFFNPDIKNRLL